MAIELIERYRSQIVSKLFDSKTFPIAWDTLYRPEIERVLGTSPDSQAVRRLGEHLYQVFRESHRQRAGGLPDRAQSTVARAGQAWERLACWYLNLGLIGTRAVVVKRRLDTPQRIRDALSVTIQDRATNSESDLVAMVLDFQAEVPAFAPRDKISSIARAIDAALSVERTRVGVIQCKTNWNDNAQAVMLWNAVYGTAFASHPISGISLGKNGAMLHDFNHPFYAFLTVPTQKPETFKPEKLAVARLANLSGGRFWALPSQEGIARNISAMFQDSHLFGPATQNWDAVLTEELRARSLPEYQIPALA